MANEAGVVKSVTGGSVRALNNITGEVRNLNAGDIVYQNEKITTDNSNSKVIITQTDGKDITLLGKDTITLDQSTSNNESFGNETVADISALQQAILNGTDLNALEETAAGGGAAGGGDGVSLSATSFTEGGHISNVNANYGNLPGNADDYVRNYSAISGGGLDTNATPESQPQPQLTPPAIMEIPSSAYNIEMGRNNEGKLGINAETKLNYNTLRDGSMDPSLDRSNDYFKNLNSVQGEDKSSISATSDASQAQKISDLDISKTFKDAVDGLTIDKGEISVGDKLLQKHYIENYQDKFDYQDGWFISKDKSTIIGSDNAKKLVVAKEGTDTSEYESQPNTTVVKVADTVKPKIFGSDKADDITVDGAKVQMISTGTGDDKINVKNGAEILTNINSGSGNDTINVAGEGTKVNGEEIVNHTGYKIRQGGIIAGDGNDIINITNKAKVKAGIYDGDGDDKINIKGGATVGTVEIEDVSARYKSIDKYKDGREITDEDRISMEAQFQQRSGVQLGHGKNTVTIEGEDTAVSRVTGYKYNHDGEFKNEDWTNTVTVKDKATVSFDIDINSINKDTVNVENNATVRGTIYTGKGSDTINVTNNSKVGGVRAESDGDTINITDSTVGGKGSFYGSSDNKNKGNFNGDDSYNKGQFEGINGDGNDVFDTVNGKDTITIKNSTVNGTILGGGYNDTINISDNSVINGIIDGEGGNDKITVNNSTVNGRAAKDYTGDDTVDAIKGGAGVDEIILQNGSKITGNVYGNAGKDIITVDSGATVDGIIYGDTKTKNDKYEKKEKPHLDIEDKGADADTITVSGKGTSAKIIAGGDGDDTITVKDGARTSYIQGDEGGDTVTVSGKDAYAAYINGRGGDDKIFVENGAKAGYVWGMWGNDKITVRGEGTTILKNVEGREDSDTIKILDGATVNGYVSGGKGENPSRYGAAQDSDGNNITIQNATVKGNVEGSTYGGDNKIEVSNSTIGGSVLGGKDKDKIDIDGGAERKGSIGGKIISGDGDDTVTIRNMNLDKVDNDYNKNVKVDTGTGNDTVNLYNVTVNNTNIWTKEGNDTINATDTTFKTTQGTGIGTGSGNDIININSGSNFESGTHISAGEGNDIININSGANLNGGHVYGYEGNDTININSGATLTNSSVRGSEGNDTISISGGATINNSGSIAINGDGGNDTLVLKNGASAGFNNLNFENKVSITHTNGEVNITDMEGDKTVDLSQLSAIADKNVKSVDMTSINGAKLNITAQDVLDINKTTGNTLTIKGGSDDTMHKTDGSTWQNKGDGTYSTTVTDNEMTHTVTIKVEDSITHDL